jgi:hypothetical protein
MILALSLAWADLSVPVQGFMTDADGVPLSGDHEVAVGVHPSSGGAAAYTEPMTVQFVGGMFSVMIGAGASADDALWTGAGDRWISIGLVGQPASTPVLVGAAPRAIRAEIAGSAETLGTLSPDDVALAEHGHDWSDISGVTSSTAWAGTVPWSRVTDQPHTYTDGEIGGLAVAAMGTKANSNPLNHDRYTNSEAVAAMGAKGNGNPLNHDRYTDAEAVAAMGAKANSNPLNHDRYTDSEAVAAVTASFGAKGDDNPRNHDRFTAFEAAQATATNLVIDGALLSTSSVLWNDPPNVVRDSAPDGRDAQVHRSVEFGTSCYDWAVSQPFPIDPAKGYEFSIWLRSTQSDLDNYMGFYAYDAGGARIAGAWNNPYFKTGQGDPSTWRKWTGYLMAHTTPDNNADGLPDAQALRTNGTDWKMPSTARYAVIRFGTCYGDGSGSGESFFASPTVRELHDATGPWIAPTFENGWTNYNSEYNPAGYYVDNEGYVHLRGLVRSGSSNAAIFTLPEGARPAYRELQSTVTHPDVAARVDIVADGRVLLITGSTTWVSLDGITFRTAGY